VNIGLMVLSGLLVSLSFPSWLANGLRPWTGWLAWIALVPALVVLERLPPRRAAVAGWVGGLACWLSTIYWVAAIHELTYFRVPAWFLMSAVLAGYWALWGWLVARAGPGRALWAAPAAWGVAEWIRGWLFTGFPWIPLGASQWAAPAVFLSARFIGVLGLSVAVVIVNVAVRAAFGPWARRRVEMAVGAAAVAVLVVLSAVAGRHVTADFAGARTVRMALLQGGFTEEEKNVLPADIMVARYEMLARKAAPARPAVMVWPETAVACPIQAPGLLPRAQKLAERTGAGQLMGALYEGPTGKVYNGVFLVSRWSIEGHYYKTHLVAFGEYIPAWFRAVSPVARKLISSIMDLSPGTDHTPIPLPGGGTAGAEVCYEAVFAEHGRQTAKWGAEVLVNVTNDAWYWRTAATWQHALGPISRAVECGRDLVRCANTGATLTASPRGAVVCEIPLFVPGVQVADVHLIRGRTFWVRMGDLPLVFVLAAVLLAAAWRRDRKA